MLTSHLDAYISRYGDFCAHDNDNITTDYFTPCACARGNYGGLENVKGWHFGVNVVLEVLSRRRPFCSKRLLSGAFASKAARQLIKFSLASWVTKSHDQVGCARVLACFLHMHMNMYNVGKGHRLHMHINEWVSEASSLLVESMYTKFVTLLPQVLCWYSDIAIVR